MIDLYVVFTDTDTIFRNAYRKRSCRRFVRNQGLLDTVVNDYSEERFKYTSGPFNYYVCTKKGKRGGRGDGGRRVHKNAYIWEQKVGRCQGRYFFIKHLVHKLITIVTRIFVSFIKKLVLFKISVLKKLSRAWLRLQISYVSFEQSI